jgi:hypothetical protein
MRDQAAKDAARVVEEQEAKNAASVPCTPTSSIQQEPPQPVLSGHKQKIQYLQKLKDEIFELKAQNSSLKKELTETKKANKTSTKLNSVADFVCSSENNSSNHCHGAAGSKETSLVGKENGSSKANKSSASSSKSLVKAMVKSS